ncbi:hypothetical protein P22_2945 [Propionispora sp. 2/2-37]|uniref:hypothetical protein n=1 Tax=Propionispora sp. 2/2-37 TaxID=1677858 RepID=UPI0006BB9888|nr:hypothetical protein [Propionispora sp. 2/2-37]CUH96834.1 hypothetical protein P22_2945 [Propionispora sp. 2/2-37]
MGELVVYRFYRRGSLQEEQYASLEEAMRQALSDVEFNEGRPDKISAGDNQYYLADMEIYWKEKGW